MTQRLGGNSGSSSLRSPEPVPVSAHAGNDPGRKYFDHLSRQLCRGFCTQAADEAALDLYAGIGTY